MSDKQPGSPDNQQEDQELAEELAPPQWDGRLASGRTRAVEGDDYHPEPKA